MEEIENDTSFVSAAAVALDRERMRSEGCKR